mgnify:CR=1 FL=1
MKELDESIIDKCLVITDISFIKEKPVFGDLLAMAGIENSKFPVMNENFFKLADFLWASVNGSLKSCFSFQCSSCDQNIGHAKIIHRTCTKKLFKSIAKLPAIFQFSQTQ